MVHVCICNACMTVSFVGHVTRHEDSSPTRDQTRPLHWERSLNHPECREVPCMSLLCVCVPRVWECVSAVLVFVCLESPPTLHENKETDTPQKSLKAFWRMCQTRTQVLPTDPGTVCQPQGKAPLHSVLLKPLGARQCSPDSQRHKGEEWGERDSPGRGLRQYPPGDIWVAVLDTKHL